jgi:hypothetical protein
VIASAVCETEGAVRFRNTDEGRRQRDALRKLERDSGRRRSAIVADLDREIEVGHDQYRRYLRGDTPLRLDQIGAFARALKVAQSTLTRALGLMDDEPVSALDAQIREALAGAKVAGGQRGLDQIAESLEPLSDEDREHVLRTVSEAIGTFRPDLIE